MKTLFLIVVLIHGAVHLLGWRKASRPPDSASSIPSASPQIRILWLSAFLLFLAAGALFLLKSPAWWIAGGIALICSQALIVSRWKEAKYGTILNLIILLPVIVAIANVLPSSFSSRYKAEVEKRLKPAGGTEAVTREDIRHLPACVQRYLEYAGVVGKPKVRNFRALFRGSMKRSLDGDWFDISARQYNFYDDPARIFYIDGAISGLPIDGLHAYIGDSATMQIAVASLFRVADARGPKMTRGETVTMFNDMCLLAPATLIDRRIAWETVDSLRARARFANAGHAITALLSFDETGRLADFLSNDRYASTDGTDYTNWPWSTPVPGYRNVGGRNVPVSIEAVWHTPRGKIPYARFELAEIEYNCDAFR